MKLRTKKGTAAIMQIMIMVISLIAVAYLMGSVNRVEAFDLLSLFGGTTPTPTSSLTKNNFVTYKDNTYQIGSMTNGKADLMNSAGKIPEGLKGIDPNELELLKGNDLLVTQFTRDQSLFNKGFDPKDIGKSWEGSGTIKLTGGDYVGTYTYKSGKGWVSKDGTKIPQATMGEELALGNGDIKDFLKTYDGPLTVDGTKLTYDSSSKVWTGKDANGVEKSYTQDKLADKIKKSSGGDTGGGWGEFGSGLVTGMKWGLQAAMMIYTMGPMFGFTDEEINAYALASFMGLTVGKGIAQGIGGKGGKAAGVLIGLAVAYITYWATYKEVEYRIVTYGCEPWQAPVGGDYCEICNKQGDLPCSEYQCKSLGQACELLNQGTDEEACAWVNRQDVLEPIIEVNPDALSLDLIYENPEAISPPDRGTKIVNTVGRDDCIKPYTAFSFGIKTNETSRCRMDTVRRNTFEEMRFYVGGSNTFKYNHTHIMALPGGGNGSLELKNDGKFQLFIRCEDANGNTNTGEFVVQYCVRAGPDTTAPLILGSEFGNNRPIAFNSSNLTTKFYIDEEAECKWAREDKDYDDMEYNMTNCGQIDNYQTRIVYTCETTFPGIKDGEENRYYIKCKDQPDNPNDEKRNINVESYPFTIFGTRPLVIESVTPNNTIIKDSTESVKVTINAQTTAGYSEGTSLCASSQYEDEGFVEFFSTNSYTHSTDLYLTEGEYDYWVKCVDAGGNEDKEKITFEVDSDSAEPLVVRAYKEEINLRISTDEPASCVYDTKDCTYLYEDGIPMTKTSDQLGHYTEWNPQTKLYIKCQDEFGNMPAPDECSIIVKPLEK